MPSINSEPLFIKWNDELEEITQQLTVINNEAMLEQIPDDYRKVEITGLVETKEEVPESGQFYVDYKVGKVTFASDVVDGTTYSSHFYGKGIILIPAKRIYTNTTNPDAISNIQDMIDNYNNLNGVDLYTKFDPNAGHKHTGVAGDGAKIPAQYIPLSDVGNLISAQNVEDALQELKTDGNNNSNKIGDLSQTNYTDVASGLKEHTSQLAHIAYLPSSFKETTDIDDTDSINRALAHVDSLGGGKVRIPFRLTPYIISSELVIGSNTVLEVDPSTTIKLADGSNCVMIWNKNKSSQTNLTRQDKNIKIIGGIWDGNRINQTQKWYGAINTSTLITGFWFSGVENLEFRPSKIVDSRTYGVMFCNVKNVLVDNINVEVGDVNNPDNGDAIHVLGPSENIIIQNSALKSEDHVIALNADDVQHGEYTSLGDITNVTIQNITINNQDGGQGMMLLSGNNALKDIRIENIKGEAAYLVGIHTFDFGAGNFDNITIDGTIIKKSGTENYPYINMYGNMGTVNLKNIDIPQSSLVGVPNRILIKNTIGTPVTSIEELNIENLKMSGISISGANTFNVIDMGVGVTVKKLKINGVTSKNNTTPVTVLKIAESTIENLELSDFVVENAKFGFAYIYDATIDNIKIDNMKMGTKSVNQFWYQNNGTPNIKKLDIRRSGNTFVRFDTFIDEIIVDNPQIQSAIPTDVGHYRRGRVIQSSNPAALGYAGWICTTPGSPYNVTWQASTAYAVDDVVRIGDWLVKCIQAGTSGATQPTVVEGDFTDGTVTWRYMYNGLAVFKTFGAVTP